MPSSARLDSSPDGAAFGTETKAKVTLEVAARPIGTPSHHWAQTTFAAHPLGFKGMMVAAKVLGASMVDLLFDSAAVAAAKAELVKTTKGKPLRRSARCVTGAERARLRSIMQRPAIVSFLGSIAAALAALAQAHAPLDRLAASVLSGGPPKDGIPSIDRPKFISASEADRFLAEDDVVFGIVERGVLRAYPQRILVWHEIVNDVVAGERITVTYCPLTGSAIAFSGLVAGQATQFGTSGKLVNSNLLMYDRATDSRWPQILGIAISGPRKGQKLRGPPVVWTTWRHWKAAYPATQVLSNDTGFARDYDRDPYGSYRSSDTYYQNGDPMFPVTESSDKLPPKEVVIGVENEQSALAIRKDLVRQRKLVTTKLGEEPIAVLYDEALDDARAYRTGGRSFSIRQGAVVDASGARWNAFGVSDRGDRLDFVDSFDVMWFAWYADFPRTQVFSDKLTSRTQ